MMKRFYLEPQAITSKKIDGELYNYMKNVMRLEIGDEFIGFTGDEFDHTCVITQIDKKTIEFKFVSRHFNLKNPKIKVDLFQALAKGDKLELVAQKATELGASNLYLIHSQNCDVTINTSRPNRLEKIVINASQQCGRSRLMKVVAPQELFDIMPILKSYDLILLADTNEERQRLLPVLNKHKRSRRIACLVGPEGGFSPSEIKILQLVATSITLGDRTLRTETAGLYMLSILNDFYEV